MSKQKSVSEILERFKRKKARKASESTAQTYVTNVKLFLEWIDENSSNTFTEVDEDDIDNYLYDCENRGLANNTIALKYTSIQQFYKQLEADNVVERLPTENTESGVKTEVPKQQKELREDKPTAVTKEEVEKLCDNVPNPQTRNKLMIRLMFQTGIRTKEMRNIRVEDINREENSIKIDNAKGEGVRTVYYTDLEPMLSEWLDLGGRDSMRPADESRYLFLTNRSEKFNINRANNIIEHAAENAGIQRRMYTDQKGGKRRRITPHALRHGFARHCVIAGMDISQLQELMGHENIETTKKYLQFTNEDLKQAVAKYAP